MPYKIGDIVISPKGIGPVVSLVDKFVWVAVNSTYTPHREVEVTLVPEEFHRMLGFKPKGEE
jgi:hypothetical protein